MTAGGGLLGTSTAAPPEAFNTAHRYIYLSCFRGSVFRLNKGLAEGEERGLREDRKEKNAQQTQRKKNLEGEVGEEIRQNRNQRRDSSAVELMRKASEGGR